MLTGPPPKFHGTRDILLHCCLRARELDSSPSQQLLRATTFGYWLSP